MGIGTLRRHKVAPATPEQAASTPKLVAPQSVKPVAPAKIEIPVPKELEGQDIVNALEEASKEFGAPAQSAGKKAAK